MAGICILAALTTLAHIIPGSAYQLGLSAVRSSEQPPTAQYSDDHHHIRRLSSHPSSNEPLSNPQYMFHALLRDVETLLNNGLLDTSRRKSKRSTQYSSSPEDSRMLKQLWDAYNSQKQSNQVAENRNFLFPSFDAWAQSFTSFFWRDMGFNVLKIVGLSALYYLAPGVLDWYTVTFGST